MKRVVGLALLLAGCGGSTSVTCADDLAACSPNPDAGPPTVIAVSRWILDDPANTGDNLDGLVSMANSANHCKLVTGADAKRVKADGADGIDDSFGTNILWMLSTLEIGSVADFDDRVAQGGPTLLFKLDNLLDPTARPDQIGVSGVIHTGTDKGSPAAFDGTDVWPVRSESDWFENAVVERGVWHAEDVSLLLPLKTPGPSLLLPIQHATVRMRVHDGNATDGLIAGVIDTNELLDRLLPVLVALDPSPCTFGTYDSILYQVRQDSDIMSDGTNGDPTKTCNAVSIGIAFEGRAAHVGALAPPDPPFKDPCAP